MRTLLPHALALSTLACSSSSEENGGGAGGTGGSAADAGADAAVLDAGADLVVQDGDVPCAGSGISKGPWSLAIDRTSAKIRWEACRPGTSPGITLTPEGGGASIKVTATEKVTTVTQTYTPPLGSNTPDYAGTWHMFEAAATGLSPSTCYSYALAADATAKGRVCTAKQAGEPFKFMAIGDTSLLVMGAAARVLEHAVLANFDFTIHAGDMQYYSTFSEPWTAWMEQLAPMLRQGGLFPAIGNHEHESQVPAEFDEYYTRFFGGAGFDGELRWYRFESGGVWFFSVDTEEAFDPASEQGQWLVTQLEDASKKPGFRFSTVFQHRPYVTCGDYGPKTAEHTAYLPIFTQFGVRLVVQAHMHGYERFEIGDITYVTTAGGGGLIGNVDENITRPECAMREASGAFFHSVVFEVKAGELAGTTTDDQGVVRDTFSKVIP